MTEQMQFLKNIIAGARTGNGASIKLLREICKACADKSPPDDLLAIGEFLYEMRRKADRKHSSRN